MRARGALSALLLSWCAGCGDGCRRAPPPILFGAPDAGNVGRPLSDAAPVALLSPGDGGAPARLRSSLVPGDGHALTLDGVTTPAPAGELFRRYIALDADGDGDRDAIVARVGASGAIAGVTFLRREPGGFVTVPLEGGAPVAAGCADVDLWSTTQRSVVVRYGCAGAANGADGGAPAGVAAEIVVLALAPSPSARLRVALLTPSPRATELALDVEALDRDGDGRDDVVVTASARRPGEHDDLAARASVVLFDRPAGLARDTSEPEASFARLATAVRGLATRRHALDAIAATERVVRLRRALCLEAGAPRVRINGAAGVACAGSAGLRGVAEALARAYLALGDVPAAAALTRADSALELGVAGGERLLADVHRAAIEERGVTARAGPFIGQALEATAAARGSALRLDPADAPNAVLLRGPVTARVELATLASTPGEGGQLAEVQLRSLDGARALQGFFQTCDGIVAALCPTEAPECMTAPVGVASLPPGAQLARITELPSPEHAARCIADGGVVEPVLRSVDLRALGFSPGGLVVAYRGRLLRVAPGAPPTAIASGSSLGGPFAPGAAASAAGDWAVLNSADGLLLRDAQGRYHLWAAAPLLGRFRQLTDFAVSNDGRVVAALLAGQLWVLEKGAAPTP